MNKISFQLTNSEILNLYNNIIDNFNSYNSYNIEKESIPDFNNITSLPDELEITNDIEDYNDYIMIKNIDLKKKMWHFRLKYFCSIFLKIIELIGNSSNEIEIKLYCYSFIDREIDIGVYYINNVKNDNNSISTAQVVNYFYNLEENIDFNFSIGISEQSNGYPI